ncbi:carbohydrate-binding protein [Streptomyces sp. YIM 98790]|uniref:dioxygenase family protein n=1 Tax=Streptomyces sp. YIM 98790 TaxID=2689077 RepID=UPI00140D9EF5|nr:carbohydrate-binding protein [Streptomyces sp. YIM 98790]
MDDHPTPGRRSGLTRKGLLKTALAAVPLSAALGGAGAATALARDAGPGHRPLTPTPVCDDGDDPTPPQMEGPYFKPGSPRRTSLVDAGTPGVRLTVSGRVFGLACLPVPDVLLDFWQADTNGAYDNAGHRFRGHQFTDQRGAFRLETIVPGLYPGRTRHLHVKAQAPGRPVLTTQLYFPGEPRNATDALYDPALLMHVRQAGAGREAGFDFVLNLEQDGGGSPQPPGGTWAAGTAYAAGDTVTHGGSGYRCLQAHTAQPGWEPPHVPALWQRL